MKTDKSGGGFLRCAKQLSAFQYTKMLYKYVFGKVKKEKNKQKNNKCWKELKRP